MFQTASISLAPLLDTWKADPAIAENVSAWRVLPERAAQMQPFPLGLAPALARALETRGISALYTHQAAAWNYAHEGRHVVVVTGTASGKTLCYNLPVLDRMLHDPQARALYLFPTKALAQDQVAALDALMGQLREGMGHDGLQPPPPLSRRHARARLRIPQDRAGAVVPPLPARYVPLSVAAYDGDTPSDARPSIRANVRVIVSNPDMLHAGILPHHTLWADFLSQLAFIVIDEMHTYRGVFGSHVANLIRRLKRVLAFYGATPQFILTSATIANPEELAERLIEEPVALVPPEADGAPKGARHFVIYNPPIVNRELGLRRSALLESVKLAQALIENKIQTIVFARTRRSVELILRYLKSNGPDTRRADGDAVRGYRSGYLPAQRREIERGLREGRVRGVVATNALELGIDIGGMGAAVLAGYPGSMAATWQQAGRAGRSTASSLAVMVTSADPLDQFLAHHPDYFFGRSVEQGLINPDNLLILLQHLRCAAFESPFQAGERFGSVPVEKVSEFLEFLSGVGIVHRSGEKYFWMSEQYPADGVSLRSASAETVTLQVEDEGERIVLGQVDRASAFWMVHPQAIYLHEAQSYSVEELDLQQNIARLRPIEAEYYTEPRTETSVRLLDKLAESPAQGASKAHGEIAVTSQVVGFRKVRWYTHELLGLGSVSLPATELHTTGYWLALEDATVAALREQGLWTNDRNEYGPNWPTQRERALERDGRRCVSCGLTEAAAGRPHEVHHKQPFRTFTYYLEANRLENLATLCANCHHRVEAAVRIRSGLAGLSHLFGHLAPFFLMCDTHDIGVHSDPQSPLAEGKPAVVIYDSVPAGIGFSERLYELHQDLVNRAYEVVETCECLDGCPSCVGPGGENGYGGKREAQALLAALKG